MAFSYSKIFKLSVSDAAASSKTSKRKAIKEQGVKSKQGSQLAGFDPQLAKLGCKGCPLNNEDLQHPKMLPTGPKRADVYIMGEAPGAEEDDEGVQFVGKSGQYLRRELPRGVEDEIRWNNTIRCRPPKNRAPNQQEIECCRHQQEQDIASTKPKVIIGFGGVPLAWFTEQEKITPWRGRAIPVTIAGHSCWYAPTFHPSYMMRMAHAQGGASLEAAFRDDIGRALKLVKRDPPTVFSPDDKDEGVELLTCNMRDVRNAFGIAKKWKRIGLDIETNALKPFRKTRKILTIAISNYETTFSIPLLHRQATWTDDEKKELFDLLRDFLLTSGRKIAHNSKFEQQWLSEYCGDAVIFETQWEDTMAQAYTLDERTGALSLEAVSTLILGMNIKAFSNLDITRLDDYDLPDVLRYNSYDAKYMLPIYSLQKKMLKQEGLLGVYRMNNETAGPIAKAERVGLVPNFAAVVSFQEKLTARIAKLDKKIESNEDVVQFKKANKFSPTSNPKLFKFFKEHLKRKEVKKADGSYSVDESVLETIDHPVARLVLTRRSKAKLLGTYVVPFLEGKGKHIHEDGLIHCNFNHLRTSTGRLSSDDPNMQNFPIRKDKEVRGIIAAPPGCSLVAFDYGAIEARVIAMASKDTFLVNALWESYDVHMEWAEKIAYEYPRAIGGKRFIKDKDVMKEFRQESKNKWVFPLFFGSALKGVAEGLQIPDSRLRGLYDEFWDTFTGVAEWQEKLKKFYAKHGYVATLTGRRRHAPLSLNEIINSPVQGTASEIVVDSMDRLSYIAYETTRAQLQFILNVHDDLTFALPNKGLDEDMEDIAREMVQVNRDFINVPIIVECKVGPNWAELDEIGIVSSTSFGHRKSA